MSKEFEAAVKALRSAGDALSSAGEALGSAGQAFIHIAEVIELRTDHASEKAAPAKTPAAKETAPEETAQADTPQEITKAMVKELLVSKSRGNHSDEVKELLHKYGASSISEIMKSDRLQEFYKEAEVIGDAG